MSINKSIISGVGWSGFQLVFDRILGFLVKLVLARILFPEDFGLIGMAVVFTAIIQVFRDVGMGAALIQKKNVSSVDYNTAFWTTIGWSVFLYALLFIGAPYIASFYNQEILTPVVRVLGISILTGPVNLVQRIRLNRQLKFRQLALINNTANLVSAIVAIIGALKGLGVWALVIQTTGPFLIRIPLFYYAGSWRPSLVFSKKAFYTIFSFGIFTTGTDILVKIVSQADYLLVGKMLGAYELGIYSFAFLITSSLRGQLLFMINKVMFPVYSKLQEDENQLRKYYFKVLEVNALLRFPLFTLLFLFADDFIEFLFPKWEPAGILIQILLIGVIISTLSDSFSSFIRGVGQPKIELKVQFVRAIIYVITIFAGYWLYRLQGVAWAFSFTSLCVTIIIMNILYRSYGISIKQLWHTISRATFCMIAIIFVTLILKNLAVMVWMQFLVAIATGLFMYRNVFREYLELFRKIRQNKL